MITSLSAQLTRKKNPLPSQKSPNEPKNNISAFFLLQETQLKVSYSLASRLYPARAFQQIKTFLFYPGCFSGAFLIFKVLPSLLNFKALAKSLYNTSTELHIIPINEMVSL